MCELVCAFQGLKQLLLFAMYTQLEGSQDKWASTELRREYFLIRKIRIKLRVAAAELLLLPHSLPSLCLAFLNVINFTCNILALPSAVFFGISLNISFFWVPFFFGQLGWARRDKAGFG